jgi:hypothetical protein
MGLVHAMRSNGPLLQVQDALKLAVMQNHTRLIQAQVGAAKSSDARHLTEDTNSHIKIIQDHTFWAGLQQVIGDIELISYATNVNQMDACCPDSVLRTLAGIYLHFLDHSEVEASVKMTQ